MELLTVELLKQQIGRDAARRMEEQNLSSSLAVALAVMSTFTQMVEGDLPEHRRAYRISRLVEFQQLVLEILTARQIESGGKSVSNGQILMRLDQRGEKSSRWRVLDALKELRAAGFVISSGTTRNTVWSLPSEVLVRLGAAAKGETPRQVTARLTAAA